MKKVLILTNPYQKNVPYICKQLDLLDQKYVIVDTDDMKNLSISFANAKTGIRGVIESSNESVTLEDIKSVLCRGLIYPTHRPGDTETEEFVANEFLQSLWSFVQSFDCYWMNPPLTSKFVLDHNKLYQLDLAQKFGLLIPETLVSNNPEELLNFCESLGGKIAVKTVKSRIFQNENEEVEAIYTNVITSDEIRRNSDSIKLAPIMAQRYIEKKVELRITMVDDQLFTCVIHSQDSDRTTHDWRRYDIDRVKHEEYKLDSVTTKKLLRLMKSWNLNYAAIDMIVTPEDDIYFLEVNPNGQYGWIEALTGMPITESIAKALCRT